MAMCEIAITMDGGGNNWRWQRDDNLMKDNDGNMIAMGDGGSAGAKDGGTAAQLQ